MPWLPTLTEPGWGPGAHYDGPAMRVLVINGFADDDDRGGAGPGVVVHIEDYLGSRGHETIRTDLAAAGFDAFMTAAERDAYHTDEPLITPEAASAAEQVRAATGLIVAYPIVHGTCPPRVKSWQERVFVLGVGFEFTPKGTITGALDHLRRACVVGIGSDGGTGRRFGSTLRERNDQGPSLARSFFLSSNRRCRSRYVATTTGETARIDRALRRW